MTGVVLAGRRGDEGAEGAWIIILLIPLSRLLLPDVEAALRARRHAALGEGVDVGRAHARTRCSSRSAACTARSCRQWTTRARCRRTCAPSTSTSTRRDGAHHEAQWDGLGNAACRSSCSSRRIGRSWSRCSSTSSESSRNGPTATSRSCCRSSCPRAGGTTSSTISVRCSSKARCSSSRTPSSRACRSICTDSQVPRTHDDEYGDERRARGARRGARRGAAERRRPPANRGRTPAPSTGRSSALAGRTLGLPRQAARVERVAERSRWVVSLELCGLCGLRVLRGPVPSCGSGGRLRLSAGLDPIELRPQHDQFDQTRRSLRGDAACGRVVRHAPRPGGAGGAKQAPIFEVDPFWPKPLPNHWVTGSTIGLSVDAQDNVWTIHRPNTVEDNFKAADIMVGDARGRDDEALPGAAGAQHRAGPRRSASAARWRRRCSSTTRPATLVKSWGGPGQGLRLAGQQPRHHRRPSGQRLAGRQRRTRTRRS